MFVGMNTIFNKDCLVGLKELPDGCVNCCVTSPPYYGLRDYGHDGQIGLEETPDQYVQKLVEVFREVRRVLRNDGTLWLNLGDTYSQSGAKGSGGQKGKQATNKGSYFTDIANNGRKVEGLKPKDLIGIPWMVAFALRSDGWYLRQDIIWSKPNPMPESVTDRCTKSHEYIFLLSKSQRYYYDSDSIKERVVNPERKNYQCGSRKNGDNQDRNDNDMAQRTQDTVFELKNKRSVWAVTTKPFSDAHFATYPQDLIVDCIKAGCPNGGLVLDPFMGAGTTAVVARKLNRNYVGFELNIEYIKIAQKRLYDELGMFS